MEFLLRKIDIFVGVGIGILFVVTFGPHFVGPNYFLDLCSNFKIPASILTVAAAFYCILLKRSRTIAIGTILILVSNTSSLFPIFYSVKNVTPQEICSEVTILQVNLFRKNDELSAFSELVKEKSPQLIYLSEYSFELEEKLRDLFERYSYQYSYPKKGYFGQAFFSKLPIKDLSIVESEEFNFSIFQGLVEYDENSVLKLIGTHTHAPINESYWQARDANLNLLAELSRESKIPVLLLGDLNTTAWSTSYKILETFTNLTNAVYGRGLLPTWPVSLLEKPWGKVLGLPLDNLLLDKSLVVKEHKTLRNIGSDHLPLWSEIQIPCEIKNRI